MVKTFLFSINEIRTEHIRGYIAKLGEKGFYGDIILTCKLPISSKDFNGEYKTLYPTYKKIIGDLYSIMGYLKGLEIELLVKAAKTNALEQRHLKLQLVLVIEEISNIVRILDKDLNILKGSEKNLLIDSLEGYYQNKKELGYNEGRQAILGAKGIQFSLDIIKNYLQNLPSIFPLNKYIINGNIELSNKYLKIIYRIGSLSSCIEGRLFEIQNDFEILNNL